MHAATGRWGLRRASILLSTIAALCAATTYGGQGQELVPSARPALSGAMRWQPWRAAADAPASPMQAELRADLVRHVETTMPIVGVLETFPLAGDLLDGRAFWAAVVAPETEVTTFVILVCERGDDGWREAARHELGYHIPGSVAPVRIEATHGWMIANGASGARGAPTWEVLRFDGESVHEEVVGNWFDVMLVDIDGDGTAEIVSEEIDHVNCYYCGMTSRSFGLYRWNGAGMERAGLEPLPAGAASEAVVAANDRAAELAGARRWTEARAVVDGARSLVAESAVFRRNASLIDLHAGAPGVGGLSEDTLLHYVFAGSWADAVDVFRHQPVLPDFFTRQPPYAEEYMMDGMYGAPPFLQAVFDAAASARRVAPALPEIEFLHGWSAYHLQEWSAALDRNDPDASTEWRVPMSNWYWGPIDADDPVVRESLGRAAALAPDDRFFVEAARIVAERADLPHADAMRRSFLLFDIGPGSCADIDCTTSSRLPDVAADAGVAPWRPWRAPGDTGRPLGEAPDGADLSRRFAAVYHDDGDSLDQVRAFPLAAGGFEGREFWAVFDPSADTCRAHRLGVSIHFASECTAPVLAVYERVDGGWRAVTQRHVLVDAVSAVAPVAVEPSHAWIVTRGVNDRVGDANEPRWEVLRFDGESLHVEVVENWLDATIADGDGDGRLEILGSRARPLCYQCPVTRRAGRLYRWTGARLAAAPLEFLSAGSTSDAAVAANNRAVALARARRWTEALAALVAARPLVAESAVFRRNANLIGLNAAAFGGGRLSEDTLLHHVFAGSWADAVDLFRGAPVGPDLFAEPLPYVDEVAGPESRYGTPPFLRAVFDATAAARAVAPPRPEIEFLHAWSAFHLDPDTTVATATHWSDAEYRIDIDEAALLEVFDRAADLAPGDPLFAEVRQVVVDRMARVAVPSDIELATVDPMTRGFGDAGVDTSRSVRAQGDGRNRGSVTRSDKASVV